MHDDFKGGGRSEVSFTLTDNSKEVLEELLRKKELALEAIGMTAEGYAKTDTPVDTGRLRNSISHAVSGDSAYIGSNVEYAPYIEMGARGRKAHHMLGKAATEHSSEYKEIALKIMKD